MMLEHFERSFLRHKNACAVFSEEESFTYLDLYEKIHFFRKKLQYLGVKKQEIIAIDEEPSIDTVAFFFACMWESLILFPLNRYLPPFFIKKTLKSLNIRWYIQKNSKNSLKNFAKTFSSNRLKDPKNLDLSIPFTLLFTSGSSSTPKLALHSGKNHLYSAFALQKTLPLQKGDSWLFSMPMYHVSGIAILFRCFLHGASIFYPQKTKSPFKRVTHASFVETQFKRACIEELSSLQCLLIGGGPITKATYELCQKHRLNAYFTYGLTEMSSHVSMTKEPIFSSKGVSFGFPHEHAEIKTKKGVLYVRGKTRFLGYSPFLLTNDEWFCTKDLATIDENGLLFIQGRKDRQFISGGENIQPEEIEKALIQIDGIISAKVLPKPCQTYGIRPIAVVKRTKNLSEKSIKKSLLNVLPNYKIPDKILFEEKQNSPLQGKFF